MQKGHKEVKKKMFGFKKYPYYRNKREYLKHRVRWFEIIKLIIPIRCNECGYDKCWHALHFHHTNPENKKFTISSMMRKKPNKINIKLMKKELKKCVCLCATHHMEKHASEYDLIVNHELIKNIIKNKGNNENNRQVKTI